METAPLKAFATKARTDLMKEVAARLDVVLAPGSNARAEQPGSVAALERAVAQTGREAVVDRVAYTWFNRIIALRYMDAKGYTGVGVVSPEPRKSDGQPQVLSDAKGSEFDSEVVSHKIQEAVTALLAPGAHGADPQGAAYGLLLEAYCRFWNKAMPFMFEREGDYTELLMPTGLLSADSVRGRAVTVLTEEVCDDVEVLGWLYQFYISERKDEVFDGFKRKKKAGAAEIPAATQLFTPHWIVRYLVENSLGRLWLLNHPHSRLADQMDHYIAPVDEETEFLKVSKPEELKVIDPAVGSGHMLTYAFDLLYAIYEEEGYTPSEIPGLILEHNLYGTEIDPRAGALAAFALTMKAAARRKLFLKNPVQPNICVLENVSFDPSELDYLWSLTKRVNIARADADEFWNAFEHADTYGSLIQPRISLSPQLESALEDAEAVGDLLKGSALGKATIVFRQAGYLRQRYAVVVANPPYMGRGAMSELLTGFADSIYPASKSDLFAMFIDRCRLLTSRGGATAMVTMQSWMFLPSLGSLRHSVLASSEISTLAHIGPRGFNSIGGEVVQTCAFVLWNRAPAGARCIWIRLIAGKDESEKSALLRQGSGRYLLPQREMTKLPNSAMGYWLSDTVRAAYADGHSVGDLVISDGQTKTGDNDRFLRCWWEVSAGSFGWGRKWVLHPKGGGNRRWYGNVFNVIDWSASAQLHYRKDRVARILPTYLWDRPGVSWSNISTSASLGFRRLDAGEIFNLKAPTVFPRDESRLPELLGFLNSPVASFIVSALNPTISFNVNDVAGLPWRDSDPGKVDAISAQVNELVTLARSDWNSFEEAAGFQTNRLLGQSEVALGSISRAANEWRQDLERRRATLEAGETYIFSHFIDLFDLRDELSSEVALEKDTLRVLGDAEISAELVSYAVGCMFGRYSIDEPGLVLADQGSTIPDFLSKVKSPTFFPDKDNVIPIIDGDWFEDDILARFRQFLRASFGEEHFAANLKFVSESLGVKDLRDYFVKSFYKEHVQRYKKRPIYWMFSSPKGSFNALVYLHRYNPSTVSTVLNDYLREYIAKLEAALPQREIAATSARGSVREVAAAQRAADEIRTTLVELRNYERDVLHPLAQAQIPIDLDDGVLVNYQKFGRALKDIGLKKGGADG